MTISNYLNGYKLARVDSHNRNKRICVDKGPPWFNDEIWLILSKKYELFAPQINGLVSI